MKRVIPFLCILFTLCLFPAPAQRANAQQEQYAAAGAHDVWFYQGPDESTALFLLPFSYYVKVLSEGGTYCAVEYLCDTPPFKKVTGYCKRDALTFVDFIPERPYLFREITVDYVLPAGSSSLGNGQFTTVKQTFVYYGMRYQSDGMYYYVCKDGTFDYIPATEEPTYEINTDYLPDPVAPDDPVAEETGGLSAVQIVVICIACVAAVAIAFFVLRQGKRRDATDEPSDF